MKRKKEENTKQKATREREREREGQRERAKHVKAFTAPYQILTVSTFYQDFAGVSSYLNFRSGRMKKGFNFCKQVKLSFNPNPGDCNSNGCQHHNRNELGWGVLGIGACMYCCIVDFLKDRY